MKVFLKDQRGRFLTETGGWSKQFGKARDFRKTGTALAHCSKGQLFDVHICIQLDAARSTFMLLFGNATEPCPSARATSPVVGGARPENRASSPLKKSEACRFRQKGRMSRRDD